MRANKFIIVMKNLIVDVAVMIIAKVTTAVKVKSVVMINTMDTITIMGTKKMTVGVTDGETL